MVFNAGAVPLGVAAVLASVAVWVFRVRLTRWSDRVEGRDRSPEEQRRAARYALVPMTFGLLFAVFFVFIYTPPSE